jgi:hypothetical protein
MGNSVMFDSNSSIYVQELSQKITEFPGKWKVLFQECKLLNTSDFGARPQQERLKLQQIPDPDCQGGSI